jgi:transcriptional regulator with XRE-family HTH domain
VADLERGQRIKARREDLHLTQPAVVELLERAAQELPTDHPMHPDKLGKPPVTLRGLQTWEQGGGIAWEKAKLLALVLQTDVKVLINGVTNTTPDLFVKADGPVDERLDRIEAALTTMLGHVENLANRAQEQRHELMDRLEALETAILHNGDVVADRAVNRVRDMVKQPDEVVRAIESLAAEFHADADQLAAQRASERGRRAAPRRPARAAK